MEGTYISRLKIADLSIALLFLLALFVTAASAETNETNELYLINNTSAYNETQFFEQEISLNANLLTSMLQMLDLNLRLINETLNSHIEEYPFLKPTLEGTDESVKAVDSILAVFMTSSENQSDTNITSGNLYETISQINSTLEYPDGMIEAANSTMGQSNLTTPMVLNIYKSVKTMTSLFSQL